MHYEIPGKTFPSLPVSDNALVSLLPSGINIPNLLRRDFSGKANDPDLFLKCNDECVTVWFFFRLMLENFKMFWNFIKNIHDKNPGNNFRSSGKISEKIGTTIF